MVGELCIIHERGLFRHSRRFPGNYGKVEQSVMKSGRIRIAIVLLLAMLLSAVMLLSACDNSDGTTGTKSESTTTGKPDDQTTGNLPQIEEISLNYAEGTETSVEIEGTKKVILHTMSNYLLISGDGEYTVKVDGGEALSPDENGQLQIENTSDVHTSLVMEITVDKKMTLTFTLIHNPGTEGNPYVVPAGETKTFEYTGTVTISVQTGWYTLTGASSFNLTNYTLGEDGLVYLLEGSYGIAALDGNGLPSSKPTSVTVAPAEAPNGYSEERPLDVAEIGKSILVLYKDTKLYYRFTAPQDGAYVFELGNTEKSLNARFATSADEYKTYYGRYYADDMWSYYPAGATYVCNLRAGESVTLAVDHTLVENMVGDSDVEVCIGTGVAIKEMEETVTAELKKRGIVCYTFTATESGVYGVSFGGQEINKDSRFCVIVGTDGEASAYYTYGQSASVRLQAGERMTILVSSEKPVMGRVGVMLMMADSEPLPEDGTWLSGFYANATYEIELYRDEQCVIYNDEEIEFKYLNGKLTFVNGSGTTFTMYYNEEGVMNLSFAFMDEEVVTELKYTAFPKQIPIDSIYGVYEDGNGSSLTIYDQEVGSGLYIPAEGTPETFDISDTSVYYDAKRNILHWSNLSIQVVADEDGKVTALVVSQRNKEDVTYTVTTKSAKRPSSKFAELESDATYMGGNYTLEGTQINNREYYILSADGNGKYVLLALNTDYDWTTFNVEITGTGDDLKITFYKLDGSVEAELTKYVLSIPEMNLEGTQDKSTSDGYGIFYVKVTKSGWYTFKGEASNIQLWMNVEYGKPSFPDAIKPNGKEYTAYLEEGALVGAMNANYTVTYSETEPTVSAEVGDESNPFKWDGSDFCLDPYRDRDTSLFYITYKASATATYTFNFTNASASRMQMYLNYDGNKYGAQYNSSTWGWDAYKDLPMVLDLTEGQEITFAIAKGNAGATNWTLSVSSAPIVQKDIDDYIGKWTNGGSVRLEIISATQVKYTGPFSDEATYTLTAEADGRYSLEYEDTMFGGFSKVYIELRDDGIRVTDFGEYDMVKDGTSGGDTPVEDAEFTKDQQGTYTGNDGYGTTFTVTVKETTVDIVFDMGMGMVFDCTDLKATVQNGVYSVEYTLWGGKSTATFRFDNGNIVVSMNDEEYTLKKEGSSGGDESEFTEDQQGEYVGKLYDETITIVVKEDAIDIYDDYGWGSDVVENVKMAFDGEWYTAEVNVGGMEWSLKLKFDNGNIYYTTDDYEYNNLYKKGESSGSDDENLFEEGQAGTYVEENGDYSLTINEDGKINYEDAKGNAVYGATVEKSVDMLNLQFNCEGATISFRFIDDASTQIMLTIDGETVYLSKEIDEGDASDVVGTWSGMGTGDWEELSFKLEIRADGTLDYTCAGYTYENCNWTLDGNVLTFTYDFGGGWICTAVCTISDGQMSILDDDTYTGVLTKGDSSGSNNENLFEEGEAGEYTDENGDYYLIINEDGTVGFLDYTTYDFIENASVKQSLDMMWLQFDLYGETIQFRFIDEASTKIQLIGDSIDVTLTKESDGDGEKPEFTEDQHGKYSATMSDSGDSYSMVIKENGKVDFLWDMGYDTISASDYTPGWENGKYTIVVKYYGYDMVIVFSLSNNQVVVEMPSGDTIRMNKVYSSDDIVFTEDQQGTYKGNWSAIDCDIELKLNADGTVDFAYGTDADGWQTWNGLATIETDGVYTFDTIDSSTFDFAFTDDGNIVLDFLMNEITLTKSNDAGEAETPSITFTEEQKGTYTGTIVTSGEWTLIVNDNTVTFSCLTAGYGAFEGTPTLNDGVYTLVLCADWLEEIRFSFAEDGITGVYSLFGDDYAATATKTA